ncbi:capsule biosynthesis protein CapF, partial [Vibrio parahaemolyticus]|nr:capsule biosynthesis protein CapF [Vibrio parahaemolyticus]
SESFENYSVINSLSITISSFLIGWISQSNLRYYSLDQDSVNRINVVLCTIFLFLALFFLGLYYFFTLTYCLVISLSISIAYNRISLSYFQARLDSRIVFKQELIRSVLLVLFILANYFYAFNSLDLILIVLSLSYLLSGSVLYRNIDIKFNFPFYLCKKYIKYGVPMSLWLVISTAFPTLERLILTKIYEGNLNDYFAINEFLIRGAGLIFTPVMMYLHPLLMKEYDNDKLKFDILVRKSIFIVSLFSGSVIFIYSKFSGFFIPSFFEGMDKGVISQSFIILMIPALWQGCFIVHKKIEALGKTIFLSFFILVSLLVYIGLALFFVPKYGLWASVYCQILSLVSYIIMVYFFT